MWEYLTACAYRDFEVSGSTYRLTKLLSYGEKESNQHCLALDEMASNTKIMISEFEKGLYTPDFFSTLHNYYRNPANRFKELASQKKPEEYSDGELATLYDAFHDAAGRTYPPMLIGFFAAYLDSYLTEKIKKVATLNESEMVTLKTTLLTIPHASFSEREEDALYDVVKKIKENNWTMDHPSVISEIKRLTDTYGWFHMEYAGEPYTETYYRDTISKRIALDLPKHNLADAKKEVLAAQRQFFDTHKDTALENLVKVLQEFAFILDDSKAFTVQSHYAVYPLFKEIASRSSLPFQDIYFLSGEEIKKACIDHKANKDLIEERKKLRVVFFHDNAIEVFSGQKAKEVADTYIEKLEIKTNQDIKGIVAYPGFYRGKVSVVLNPNDYSKFKDGDVLVTRDGSAEFTYFLQHAGAVIADQGGIISHAAIVARESKVPTILSTKVGTKILKDGDIVEVDATKGIVRILP